MLRRGPGFTLVELLVAMALSLIVILAVTQVFRLVGDNVLAGRAVLEMSGQLRSAADQLQRDLGGLTVPVRPWPETSSGAGYFEYYEGPFWDLGLGPGAAGIPPAPRVRPWYSESSVGDIDDVLMFTARAEGAPFVGQIMGTLDLSDPTRPRVIFDPLNPTRTTIESQVAEVVWFTRFNNRNGLDANGNVQPVQPDPGEVTLHRRVFLVLPSLDLSDPDIQALPPNLYYSAFDVSTSLQWNSNAGTWNKTANSLETVTLRQNRVAHNGYPLDPTDPLALPDESLLPTFPYRLSRALLIPQGSVVTRGEDLAWGAAAANDDGLNITDDIWEAGSFGSDDLTEPSSVAFVAESFGSDVILSNLLAFDVKAYDPLVVVQRAVSGSDPVLPGDPGYRWWLRRDDPDLIGQGGYVDLFWGRYSGLDWHSLPPPWDWDSNPSPLPDMILMSALARPPHYLSQLYPFDPNSVLNPEVWGPRGAANNYPATYDTWSMFYEHDGLDQDPNRFRDPTDLSIIDQGTNGIDDDGINGVDDVGERETSPPYPVPLRGIQVRLRIIDRDSRQVRQMTVSSDFIPE
jgi:prepilin-type N-terminal cleavage/methylation domain-containing protein